MSRFYEVQVLGRCEKCDKPATFEVRGPHNAVYGHVCARHVNQKITELERTHAETPTAEMPHV